MIGQIQATRKSGTGKTLGVQIDGKWYTSKNWELEQNVGKSIIFEPSNQNFPDGSTCQWLNDYVFEAAGNTPSGQAMNMAVARGEAAMGVTAATQERMVTRAIPNKDSLIDAPALAKSIRGSKEEIWEAFVFFYHKFDNWDSSVPF